MGRKFVKSESFEFSDAFFGIDTANALDTGTTADHSTASNKRLIYEATEDCFVYLHPVDAGSQGTNFYIYIDGVAVSMYWYTEYPYNAFIILPLCKGQVLTHTEISGKYIGYDVFGVKTAE